MTTVMTPPVPANAQEAYEFIRAFFIKQGDFAYEQRDADDVSQGGNCCYRTEDGRKCAAGCLIPDDLYDKEIEYDQRLDIVGGFIEGKFVDQVINYHERLRAIFNGEDQVGRDKLRFIATCQEIHDSEARDDDGSIEGFIKRLDAHAERNGLKVLVS